MTSTPADRWYIRWLWPQQVHSQLTSQSIPLLWSSSWATWRWAALVLECWINKQINKQTSKFIPTREYTLLWEIAQHVVSKQSGNMLTCHLKKMIQKKIMILSQPEMLQCGQSQVMTPFSTRLLLLVFQLNSSKLVPNSKSCSVCLWGVGRAHLTSVGKASSMQKDRDTKRTPAGVAGGRLVISCRSCSASSSVGLQGDQSTVSYSLRYPRNHFLQPESATKQLWDLLLGHNPPVGDHCSLYHFFIFLT